MSILSHSSYFAVFFSCEQWKMKCEEVKGKYYRWIKFHSMWGVGKKKVWLLKYVEMCPFPQSIFPHTHKKKNFIYMEREQALILKKNKEIYLYIFPPFQFNQMKYQTKIKASRVSPFCWIPSSAEHFVPNSVFLPSSSADLFYKGKTAGKKSKPSLSLNIKRQENRFLNKGMTSSKWHLSIL